MPESSPARRLPLRLLASEHTCGSNETGSVGAIEHHGRKHAVPRASDVLADNRTDAVLAAQSSGPGVLLLHCGPSHSAAHAWATRLAFGSALGPAGENPEILAGTVEASSLPHSGDHAYPLLCGLPYPGDAGLFSSHPRHRPEFRFARFVGGNRAHLRHRQRLRCDYCLPLHDRRRNSPDRLQAGALRGAIQVR